MTKQETFKKRVRARMKKTGERYAAARRSLLEQASSSSDRRPWVSPPEVSEQAVIDATGKGWDDWCDLIDAWPGNTGDHAPIAAHLHNDLGIEHWWAQTITVGYERITGLRLPYQRPDGTFEAGKSRTITGNAAELRALLLDAAARRDLFPGHTAELLSKPSAKAIRIAIGPGVAQFSVEQKDATRARLAVIHRALPTYDAVQQWKFFWDEWLDALDG